MREAIKQINPKIKDKDIDQFKSNYDSFTWFVGLLTHEDPKLQLQFLFRRVAPRIWCSYIQGDCSRIYGFK